MAGLVSRVCPEGGGGPVNFVLPLQGFVREGYEIPQHNRQK